MGPRALGSPEDWRLKFRGCGDQRGALGSRVKGFKLILKVLRTCAHCSHNSIFPKMLIMRNFLIFKC